MSKKIFYLQNLECAHCGALIENQVSRLPQVQSASLVFATGQLHVEAPDPEQLLPRIEEIIHNIEPAVTVQAHRPGSHPVLHDCPMEEHHHHDHGDDCCGEHHHHDHGDDCCGEHHHHDHGDDCCGEHHHHDHEDDCCGEHHHHDHGDDCCGEHHHHDHGDDCCGEHHHHDHGDDCCCGEHHHHDHGDDCCCGEHHHHDHEDDCCGEHHHHDHGDDCCCGEHEHTQDVPVKQIYYLENLGCAHCAAKIEDRVAKLPEVVSVSLVFPMKQLHVVSAHHSSLLPTLQQIVVSVEPQASISARQPGAACTKKIYYLENLGCAHCAAKIETQVSQLPQVESVSLVFPMKQLHVVAANHRELLPVLQEIVHQVEPEADISDRSAEEAAAPAKSRKKLGDIGVILTGAALYLLGIGFEKLLPDLGWLPLTAYVVAYLILGLPVLKTAGGNLFRGRLFDENFLMSIATLGAFLIGEYPEAVGVMLFFRIGEAFEAKAVARSRQEIMTAVDLRPDTVVLADTGVEIPAEEAVVGDRLLVRPGDRIPLDCVLLEGESRLDTAPITGEPVPVAVRPGDCATSGCINLSGKLVVRVEKPLAQSMVTKILEAVESASASKPKIDRFISKFARVYTPFVVIAALLTALIPSLVTGDWNYWIYTALSFLVMSCPCALVLSVPLAFFSGIGAGSKQGILFKGGLSMEALAHVKVIAMDKTGTVTKGNFVLQKADGPAELLEICAGCELHSSHPIAQSVVAAAREKGLSLTEPEQVEEIAGFGIRALHKGRTVLCGNQGLMEKFSVSIPESAVLPGTGVLVAADGVFLGSLEVSDTIKPEAADAVKALHGMKVETAMVTGDSEAPAREVSRAVGIRQVFAKLLPQEKLRVLQQLREKYGPVMFVGDGINDAPVLAGADVGAAMGSGADAAIEAADVVFMTSELDAVPAALRIAQSTRSIAWQNVVFALAVKLLVMLLGLLGHANMWLAVFADTGVAMLCVLNSIRVLYRK